MAFIPATANHLAAVGLIRAVVVDDADSGLLIISQRGGCKPGTQGDQATSFITCLAAVAARALLSAHGYNVERSLRVLDTWAAEYADEAAGAP